ncbi:shikimate dehydrogenase [Lacibacterium aquatile]|uniref:Shikimate dehydrogenase (NADP(+)) n=1 Tax=Lacibacterium aquatile TaxID=1168082 RepID=A0ABW5DW20_9PROT
MSSHTGKTRVAGVMGWPISHSRSPILHGFWLAEHKIDGAYIPLPVRPDDFAAALKGLAALGFAGANVTVPHKEAAFALVDQRDEAATKIGAVNTIVVLPDGRLEGRNTDAYGFIANLQHNAPQWRADAGPAVVLGAGGAARAVVHALLKAGAPEVRIVNRSLDKAEALARTIGGSAHSWDELPNLLTDAGLLVNTTSLGMNGYPPLEVDLAPLPSHALVSDIVYAPLVTKLLSDAKARGLATVDGIGMLLWQAQPAFEAFFGVRPTVSVALQERVLAG